MSNSERPELDNGGPDGGTPGPAGEPVPDSPLKEGEQKPEPRLAGEFPSSPPLIPPEEFRRRVRQKRRAALLLTLIQDHAEELRPVLRQILGLPEPQTPAKRVPPPPREPEEPKAKRDWW